MRLVLGDLLDHAHAPVEIRVERQHQRAVGDRLDQLRDRDLALGQEHDGLNAGGRAVDRQRGRSVAGRGAGDRLDRRAFADHLLHLRDQHGHAQVFEGPAMGVAAELDPKVVDADRSCRSAPPRTGSCRPRTARRCSRRGSPAGSIPSCPKRRSHRAIAVRL